MKTLQAYTSQATGVHLTGYMRTPCRLQARTSQATGVHLAGVHLAGVQLAGVHLAGVYLAGVHLKNRRASGRRLAGICNAKIKICIPNMRDNLKRNSFYLRPKPNIAAIKFV